MLLADRRDRRRVTVVRSVLLTSDVTLTSHTDSAPGALRGHIEAGGGIRGGLGFSLVKTAAGTYAIGFAEPYVAPPVVMVTPATSRRVASAAVSARGAEVTLADLAGAPTDTGFAFVVQPVDGP